MAGPGVFQFSAASVAVEDTNRFHVVLCCSDHVVFAVSDHDDLIRIGKSAAFHDIADHIPLMDSVLSHISSADHLKILCQPKMLYDLHRILLRL